MRFSLYVLQTHVKRKMRFYLALGVVVVACVFFWWQLCSPPPGFPTNHFVVIPEGASVRTVAGVLASEKVIRNPATFALYMRLSGSDRGVNAGRYLFEKPLSVFEVARRVALGETGATSVRVTFPEGTSTREMGEILGRVMPDFDERAWAHATQESEGYLFPDTYFFEPGTPPGEIAARLRRNFDERTKDLPLDEAREVVTMASLVEEEANTPEDRRIVAGILWKRIEEGMRLQVDATFGYIRGVSGYEPTGEDPEIDSPYNTYRYDGLPPGPITNPGLDSLRAALYPTETDYFYYATGRDGRMYYARTFDEHKRNVELHL